MSAPLRYATHNEYYAAIARVFNDDMSAGYDATSAGYNGFVTSLTLRSLDTLLDMLETAAQQISQDLVEINGDDSLMLHRIYALASEKAESKNKAVQAFASEIVQIINPKNVKEEMVNEEEIESNGSVVSELD